MLDIASPEDDQSYREGYEKIVETLKMMKDKGIFIVPGTDLGGAFFYHRELELYQQLGYTPAELVKLATYDMAQYLGDENLGSIARGKLADFFLTQLANFSQYFRYFRDSMCDSVILRGI